MLRQFRVRPLLLSVLLLLPMLTSCKDETVVGAYSATTFTRQTTGEAPIDVLAAGGSINLVIHSDMTTSGTLIIPASLNNGTAMSLSLLGEAAQVGGIVTVSTIADTFIRDMEFTFDGEALSATDTFASTTITVVLSK